MIISCTRRHSTHDLPDTESHVTCSKIPYSGKLLSETTFTNFVVLWVYAKVFSAKCGVWRPLVQQKRAIRESFPHENFHQFAKVFSLESFRYIYGTAYMQLQDFLINSCTL